MKIDNLPSENDTANSVNTMLGNGIGFRVWSKLDNIFLKPYPEMFTLFGETTCFDLIMYQMKDLHPENTTLSMLKDIEVNRWTGLFDVNGNKIFEGDIVRWDDKSNGKYWRVCKLIWNISHFELHGVTFDTITPNEKKPVDFKFGSFIYEYNGILEIIGNVYQSDSALYTVA